MDQASGLVIDRLCETAQASPQVRASIERGVSQKVIRGQSQGRGPMTTSHRFLRTALLVAVMGIGTTACMTGAHYRNPVQARGVENQAYNSGYRDGQAQGRVDGRHNRRPDPAGASRYRSGDHDYNQRDQRDGTRDEYRGVYRNAFEQGYEVGYRETR
jgi:hypothetical protein